MSKKKEFEVVFYHTVRTEYKKVVVADSEEEATEIVNLYIYNGVEFEEDPEYLDEVTVDFETTSVNEIPLEED